MTGQLSPSGDESTRRQLADRREDCADLRRQMEESRKDRDDLVEESQHDRADLRAQLVNMTEYVTDLGARYLLLAQRCEDLERQAAEEMRISDGAMEITRAAAEDSLRRRLGIPAPRPSRERRRDRHLRLNSLGVTIAGFLAVAAFHPAHPAHIPYRQARPATVAYRAIPARSAAVVRW